MARNGGLAMRETLTTARLSLRRFTPADTARVVEIQSNWNVTRMLRLAGYPPTFDDIGAWLIEHQAEWAAGTGYRFAVLLDDRLIGACDVDGVADGAGDLGYWYDEPFWGRGFAFEAARAVLDFARDDVGLTRLTSGHAADNPASGRVLTKLGFRKAGEGVRRSRSRGEDIAQWRYVLDRL
jgi:RimJ/RimL family protein N-acetyltransferase